MIRIYYSEKKAIENNHKERDHEEFFQFLFNCPGNLVSIKTDIEFQGPNTYRDKEWTHYNLVISVPQRHGQGVLQPGGPDFPRTSKTNATHVQPEGAPAKSELPITINRIQYATGTNRAGKKTANQFFCGKMHNKNLIREPYVSKTTNMYSGIVSQVYDCIFKTGYNNIP